MMPPHGTSRSLFGRLALGLAALLLTVFPRLRPFFPLDPILWLACSSLPAWRCGFPRFHESCVSWMGS
jgi:hypothetical protein